MNKKKLLWIAALGSTLELYDFTLFAVMAPVFAVQFFPHLDGKVALFLSLATFACGFIVRPFTAILWGYLGDRFGRKVALSYTLLAMAVPTLAIGLLPTYHDIGFWAPVLLMLCRMCQGASMSGEFNGAMIFILEHHPDKQGGPVGLINAINTIGIILATLLGIGISLPNLPPWAWRVPFLLGALIGVLGFWIRKRLSETPAYQTLLVNHSIVQTPLKEAFKAWQSAGITFLQAAINGIVTYTMIAFMGIYLGKYLHFSKPLLIGYSITMLIISMAIEVSIGKLIDRYKLPIIMRLVTLIWIPGVFALFYCWQQNNLLLLAIGMLLGGLFLGSFAVVTHAFIQNLFPPQYRYSGIAFFYNLGMSLVGGLTPLALTWAFESTRSMQTPAFFIVIATIFYWVFFELFQRKNG